MSDRYDPQATEDAPLKNDYVSRKDAKWFILLLIVAGVAVVPLYRWGKDQRNKTLCQAHVKALADALNLYAEQNDDRYPPLYNATSTGVPFVAAGGVPVTWATSVHDYHNLHDDLSCPAADPGESAHTQFEGATAISYGLYAAHPTVTRTNIDRPDETILIAETSNQGALGSFDPLPYKNEGGQPIDDAFVIGWDNSNEKPSEATKSVTRLAFRDMASGVPTEKTTGRHSAGIYAVTISGRRVVLGPGDARTSWNTSTLRSPWTSQP